MARRVLSVGSPQHGTDVAELAAGLAGRCPEACRQLAPGSDLLRGLNARDETPDGPRFVSVWSEADETVVPTDSARLEGALNLTVQSLCPDRATAHGALPSDPVVLALLDTALGTGPPRVPTVTCSAGDVLGREVGPGRAEQDQHVRPPCSSTPRTRSRHRIGSRKKSTNDSQYRVGR